MNSTARRPMKAVKGLSSIPAPFPPAVSTDPPRTEDRAGEVGEKVRKAPAEPVARKAASPRSRAAHTVRPVGLSLPGSLLEQLRARARSTGRSQPDVLMDAISASQERLEDLVHQAQVAPVKDGMFLRRPKSQRAEPMATLTLRMLTPNVDVIDKLVTSTKAPSRSALCAAALRHYLTEA